MSAPVVEPRWYTYDFPAKVGVKCGLAGCVERHPVVYVGKTNEPWRRHFEHLKDKEWLRYTSGYRIHERTYATEQECLAAEEAMIRAWRPLANDVHNRDNPHRLVFSNKATPAGAVARRRPAPVKVPVRKVPAKVARRERRIVVSGTLWLCLASALWMAAGHAPMADSVRVVGAGAGAGLVVLGEWLSSLPKARFKRTVGALLAGSVVTFVVAVVLPAVGSR